MLKNCEVTFSQSVTNASYVTVRSWLNNAERSQKTGHGRLDESRKVCIGYFFLYSLFLLSAFEWNDELSTLKIRLTLTKDIRFLLCSVHFHLAPDFSFKSLQLSYAPAQSYVDIESTVSIKATQSISFRALHAQVSLQSVAAPSIQFNIGDGCLRFILDERLKSYYETPIDGSVSEGIAIKSRTSPVFLESSIPISLRMSPATASKALVRSVAGTVPAKPSANGVIEMVLSPTLSILPTSDTKTRYFPIDIEIDNGALYVDVNTKEAELNVVRPKLEFIWAVSPI